MHPSPFLLCACVSQGRKALVKLSTYVQILGWNAKEGVKMLNIKMGAENTARRLSDSGYAPTGKDSVPFTPFYMTDTVDRSSCSSFSCSNRPRSHAGTK